MPKPTKKTKNVKCNTRVCRYVFRGANAKALIFEMETEQEQKNQRNQFSIDVCKALGFACSAYGEAVAAVAASKFENDRSELENEKNMRFHTVCRVERV